MSAIPEPSDRLGGSVVKALGGTRYIMLHYYSSIKITKPSKPSAGHNIRCTKDFFLLPKEFLYRIFMMLMISDIAVCDMGDQQERKIYTGNF